METSKIAYRFYHSDFLLQAGKKHSKNNSYHLTTPQKKGKIQSSSSQKLDTKLLERISPSDRKLPS
jgi:hypothetical protein